MIAQFLLLMALPALLATAGAFDLASFTIPNFISLALAAAFCAFALAVRMPTGAFGWHLLAGLIGLSGGFALFALGYIGGGDAKLYAAITLWLGLRDILAYTLIATVLGGVLTLMLLAARQLPLPAGLARQGWIIKLHDGASGIPYGVALAVGALAILPQAEILHLAAIG